MKRGRIEIKFSNRLLYTLIALGIIVIITTGVYGALSTTVPNPGHNVSELQKCTVAGEILKMNAGATAWECAADAGITTETDPKIGAVTDAKWCKGDATGKVQCNAETPTLTETDPQVSDLTSANDNKMCFASGNVIYCNRGITIDGSNNLAVTGSVTAGSFLYSSDRSLKTNIQPLKDALAKVQQLNGVSFNWKSNGEKSLGFIAQDVEKVLPELVSGAEGNKAVAYGNIVAVLVEAVKEQQKQIDDLKIQIQELKEN